MKNLFGAATIAAMLCATSGFAATAQFDVHANNNVWNEGKGVDDILNTDPGLATGLSFALGELFSAAVTNSGDTWNFCSPSSSCTVDADGVRPASGTPLGLYSDSGAAFNYGTLVGRVGTGAFFAIGTSGFSGPANAAGELRLYHWDHNTNNSGSINVTVTYDAAAVPLPASLPLLLVGLGAVGAAARRARKG